MPPLLEDLAFAERLKEALPNARLFLFGNVIQTTLESTGAGRLG